MGRAMEEITRSETVDIDDQRFILLEFGRRWPRYVLDWSVRQRAGESDFPLAGGTLDRLPPPSGEDIDALWEELRQEALGQANQAVGSVSPAADQGSVRRSFWSRLFGRG